MKIKCVNSTLVSGERKSKRESVAQEETKLNLQQKYTKQKHTLNRGYTKKKKKIYT